MYKLRKREQEIILIKYTHVWSITKDWQSSVIWKDLVKNLVKNIEEFSLMTLNTILLEGRNCEAWLNRKMEPNFLLHKISFLVIIIYVIYIFNNLSELYPWYKYAM